MPLLLTGHQSTAQGFGLPSLVLLVGEATPSSCSHRRPRPQIRGHACSVRQPRPPDGPALGLELRPSLAGFIPWIRAE